MIKKTLLATVVSLSLIGSTLVSIDSFARNGNEGNGHVARMTLDAYKSAIRFGYKDIDGNGAQSLEEFSAASGPDVPDGLDEDAFEMCMEETLGYELSDRADSATAFDGADTDDDGAVGLYEFLAAGELRAEARFAEVDGDADGVITGYERVAHRTLGQERREARRICVAQLLDMEGDTNTVATETAVTFTLTDTQQEFSFDNDGNVIHFPAEGEALYGQDAQYVGLQPSFRNNGDSTVSDLVTGLLWEKTPTFDTYQHEDAVTYCETLETGGYDDWRMPTIKELYSLADYRGELLLDGVSTPYIDTTYFDFEYPAGDRQYAGQYWSSTRYTVLPNSDEEDQMKYFGFNFADGHIKAYGTAYTFDGTPVEGVLAPGMYVRCVSGEENVYGVNQFVDNGDGAVTDTATGLMWQQTDDGQTRNWEDALAYAENLELAGYDDWRLPNAKELQSIVQYEKSDIPAIDETFFTLTNPDSYFWTSTTHGDFKYQGIYIAFGRAWSIPVHSESGEYIDEHGAGAQRSDPKSGNPEDYSLSSENAADLYRIYNYVLAVRNVSDQPVIQE